MEYNNLCVLCIILNFIDQKIDINIKVIDQSETDRIRMEKQDNQIIPFATWYQSKCTGLVNELPSSIALVRSSIPFRLIIEKISGVDGIKKLANSASHLRLMLTFISVDFTIIGKTCYHLCQIPVPANGKFPNPICFYYHSRINKAYSNVKLIIRFDLLSNKLTSIDSKDGIVESRVPQGISVVDFPFEETSSITGKTFKNSELDLIMGTKQLVQNTGLTFTYHIESNIQIKNLIKFIPSQVIVSSQTHISGILNGFPQNDINAAIEEQSMMIVNFKICQIHIPDKFQQAVKSSVEGMPQSDKNSSILQRKIVVGFHNQYKLVNPTIKLLQLIGKQATGEQAISVYQGLSEKQVMKLPYYLSQENEPQLQALAISLLYCYGQAQYEVAIFAFEPNLEGSEQQISESMIAGSGIGFYSSLLPIKVNQFPTIALQCFCENESKRSRIENDWEKSQIKLSYRDQSYIKSPNEMVEQSQKMMQELERERLELEKEKEELDHIKATNYMNNQQDFEKKLEEEKEQLRIRQERIENQYRQEIQKEIRQKVQLESEIRAMKEIIAMNQKDYSSPKESHVESEYSYGQSVSPKKITVKQKLNPNYLISQEETIPISEVRDIMSRTIQVNQDVVQKELKNYNIASKFTIMFSSVVWSPSVNPPKSFFLVIRFFNFNQITSDPLGFIHAGEQYSQLIRLNHYNYNLEDTTPTYQFVVDPSQYSNPQIIQEDLVNFLCKNNTIIDLFDASSFLYIGQINVRMNQLLRGTKPQVMIAKQYNLVRFKSQQNYGTIQLLIKNQSISCKQQVSIGDKKVVRQSKKKVVSNNPMVITKDMLEEKSNIELVGAKNQIKIRQEKRIQLYKKKIAQNTINKNFDDFQNVEKGKLISKINEYKQKKMPQLLKKIYEGLLTETITINPHMGQANIFLYQFTNTSQSPSSFKVSTQDEKEQLTLVKNAAEWKYFVSRNNYPSPKFYDCINNEGSVYLSPGETIPLVFKYLSFSKGMGKNVIVVTVTKEENSWIAGGFTLNVQPHESIVNHSYILYQPGDEMVDLSIPVIYSSNQVRTHKRLLLTIEGPVAEWLNEYEIMLKMRTPQIMTKLKFNMLLYEDDYMCQLKQNWQLQLYSFEGVYALSRVDQKTKFKISIPQYVLNNLKPSQVNFYSSHPELVFDEERMEGMRLSRGSVENWCQLYIGKPSAESIQITCVSDKKQLLYGWIVQIYPYIAKNN